jgi:hypothetical protein
MIGDSLTIANLLVIKEAMDKIKQVDRSQYFTLYYGEIMERIKLTTKK